MSKPLRLKHTGFPCAMLTGVAALALLGVNHAFAQDTFTLTSGPTVTFDNPPITEVGSNTITFSPTGPNSVSVFNPVGTPDVFTSTGGDGTITVEASGNFSAAQGDIFNAVYDFTLSLTGGGTLAYSATGTATASTIFGPISEPVFTSSSGTTPLQGPSSMEYSGTASATVPTSAFLSNPVTGTWDVTLVATWNGAAAGDTVTVDIPQGGSIDLAVAPPVPEPAALPLLALGLVMFAGVRRFLPGHRST